MKVRRQPKNRSPPTHQGPTPGVGQQVGAFLVERNALYPPVGPRGLAVDPLGQTNADTVRAPLVQAQRRIRSRRLVWPPCWPRTSSLLAPA